MTLQMQQHGTISSYTNRKCRCDDCRRAIRDYMRGWNVRNPGYSARAARRRYHALKQAVAS